MKHFFLITLVFFVCVMASAQKMVSLQVNGSINPATAAHIKSGIEQATASNAEFLLIHLNTPGGLLKSTRVIVEDMMAAKVPIVVFVNPAGAHAGSAGVFITLAAHIAVMAPGTNIGAAHPVSLNGSMDSIMNHKATNDAAAFIRTIAEKRDRNVIWAEEAVRNSVSITAKEALEKGMINFVAADVQALLTAINHTTIELPTGSKTIQTAAIVEEIVAMNWFERLLDTISDPNIAYILMMLGFYGILFELFNPGAILPGVVGGISIILAFYSMHTLPINYAGLALIIFGIILFLLEIKITSYGLLTIGGIISLFLGSMMLIKPESGLELASISQSVIIPTVLCSAAFFFFIVGLGLKAQKNKTVTGLDAMIGEVGKAVDQLAPVGNVLVFGEIWEAESVSGIIEKEARVVVTGKKGFKLFVEKQD